MCIKPKPSRCGFKHKPVRIRSPWDCCVSASGDSPSGLSLWKGGAWMALWFSPDLGVEGGEGAGLSFDTLCWAWPWAFPFSGLPGACRPLWGCPCAASCCHARNSWALGKYTGHPKASANSTSFDNAALHGVPPPSTSRYTHTHTETHAQRDIHTATHTPHLVLL